MANYQTNLPCAACGDCVNQKTFHHVITRGARPDLAEKKWNKQPLCFSCHGKTHQKGMNYMAQKYVGFKNWLKYNGWEFDDYLNKWTHPSASLSQQAETNYCD